MTNVRCTVRDGLMLLDHWSKSEAAMVLFADKGLRRIGDVRIISVSYEQQSITVEMGDGSEAEFYLVDTEMCQGVNSDTLIEEYADLGWKNALAIRFPDGNGGGLTFAEPARPTHHFRSLLVTVLTSLRRFFATEKGIMSAITMQHQSAPTKVEYPANSCTPRYRGVSWNSTTGDLCPALSWPFCLRWQHSLRIYPVPR